MTKLLVRDYSLNNLSSNSILGDFESSNSSYLASSLVPITWSKFNNFRKVSDCNATEIELRLHKVCQKFENIEF